MNGRFRHNENEDEFPGLDIAGKEQAMPLVDPVTVAAVAKFIGAGCRVARRRR